ncbi:MAG: permease-like cell division protein FtsX [Bacilli bacterium]
MKPFRLLKTYTRDAFKNLFRNFSLTFASIFSITITLLVVAFSFMLSLNISNFSETIKKDVSIFVFLDESTTYEKSTEIQSEIESFDNIGYIKLIRKDEVLKDLSEDSEAIRLASEEWEEGENPLLDNFHIKVDDIEKIDNVAKQIEKIDNVTSVVYGAETVEKMINVFGFVQNANYITVIALIFVSIFLISNTIKITIFSRKREIEIMRLVGASNISIKIPFMIEGLFTGIIGSIIPALITIFGYTYLFEHFSGNFISPLFNLVTPAKLLVVTLPVILIISVIIGMFGSLNAARKYLKI